MNQPLAPPSRSRRWLTQFPRAIPVGIFLAILAVAALSIFAIERLEKQKRAVEAQEVATQISSALQREVSANIAYLRASEALFYSRRRVDGDLFQSFVGALRASSENETAEGIGWAPLIGPGDLAAWRAQVRDQSGMASVTLDPALGDRDLAVPVTFIAPDTIRNRRAVGFDMYSEATRRVAMDEAVRLAEPVATGRLVLVQEGGGDAPGFIIYLPVFADGAQGGRVLGFVYSAFTAEKFVQRALEVASNADVALRIYEGRVSPARELASIRFNDDATEFVEVPFDVSNRTWILQVESPQGEPLSNLSLLTLLFSLLIASLLMVVARLLTQQAMEDNAALAFFEEQASIRNSLTRELNHRVKNTLANVLSIIALTRRRATSLDEFATSLTSRIRALSATHDLLTQSEWGTTPLRAVVEAELAPYGKDASDMVDLTGPLVELAPNDALSLGLALHELAANAAKYGALSVPGGRIDIAWDMISPDRVSLSWREYNGPEVAQENRRRGFGTDLIERIVSQELGSPVELDFASEGVHCTLCIPVREPSDFAMRAQPQG
jgi:two-component sensor histidine kinase